MAFKGRGGATAAGERGVHGAERLGELQDRSALSGLLEQAQRCAEHLALARDVVGRPERPAHQVSRDDDPREPHAFGVVAERPDLDRHRGDARLFERPRGVSHGHVTDFDVQLQIAGQASLLRGTVAPA